METISSFFGGGKNGNYDLAVAIRYWPNSSLGLVVYVSILRFLMTFFLGD